MWLDEDQSVGGNGRATARDDCGPMSKPDLRIHHIFDFIVAAFCVILFAPIVIVTAIAVKLESRGPVFIRRPTLGRDKRVIKAFRFRFVKVDDPSTTPGLTRVGRILGGTGIDELPQLFNVLLGEMSFNELLRSILRDGVFRR